MIRPAKLGMIRPAKLGIIRPAKLGMIRPAKLGMIRPAKLGIIRPAKQDGYIRANRSYKPLNNNSNVELKRPAVTIEMNLY